MRKPFLYACALAVAALSLASLLPAPARAIGPPSENYTISEAPTSDPSHEELKPPVPYYLKGPTSQTAAAPPSFIATFTSPEPQNTVVGGDQWYVDVDINSPGWLYMYEYYPRNNNPSGRWIIYKWQVKQSGVWDIGPFTAPPDEPEGIHVYGIWFYSDGQWAARETATPKNGLIYWTYLRNAPEIKILLFAASPGTVKPGDNVTISWDVEGSKSLEITPAVGPVQGPSGSQIVQLGETTDFVLTATGLDGRRVKSDPVTVNVSSTAATPSPTPPVTGPPATPAAPSLKEQLLSPVTWLSVLAVIVIVVLGLLLRRVYLKRWANPESIAIDGKAPPAAEATPVIEKPVSEVPEAARARLTLPDGLEIPLMGNTRIIGRAELSRALGLDELLLVSRKQFQITYGGGQYYVEDMGGPNSTRLNGEDIKGKAPLVLHDGDVIDAAGAVKLKFLAID